MKKRPMIISIFWREYGERGWVNLDRRHNALKTYAPSLVPLHRPYSISYQLPDYLHPGHRSISSLTYSRKG